jgi:hypothetical protein
MVIYKATNLINGKCYIGQTIQTLKSRKSGHISDAYNSSKPYKMVISKAIKKYGENNFKWEIICDAETQGDLNKLEAFHILENNSLTPHGYNKILFQNATYKQTNGRTRDDITEDALYVAISKSNSIREVSDYLGIAYTTTKRYLKKYNFYKYMFEKSRRNCKYSHKHEYDKNILS